MADKLIFLYTNIGRGHPAYLDGIVDEFIRRDVSSPVRVERDVLELSSGISEVAWRTARWMYKHGSSGGLLGSVYSRLRRSGDSNRSGLLLKVLGSGLTRALQDEGRPVMVAHPTLVAALKNRPDLMYQHGEVVCPDTAQVRGASLVFVPTDRVAESFLRAGYSREQVLITGLCIEPALRELASDSVELRMERINSEEPLTGLFVSSGAEPKQHLMKLVAAACSAVRKGGRAVILAHRGGGLHRMIRGAFKEESLDLVISERNDDQTFNASTGLLLVYSSRRQENEMTVRLFSEFDYFVAPPHERTNWAIGLGLPMFVLTPTIGPYAHLNLGLLQETSTALVIDSLASARKFGLELERCQASGELMKMAENGWGKYDIDGFSRIVDSVIERYGF